MEDQSEKLFKVSASDIPDKISLFPLENVLLLPFGKLPLNVFETKYLKMFFDSLSEKRLIGIVQPKNTKGDFFDIGCVGKITSFIETPDNRIVLNLDGVCRFKIINHHLTEHGYFKADIKTDDYSHDINMIEPMIDRQGLIKKYSDFFKFKKYELDKNVLEETSNLQLLTTLTMLAPFSKIDKQTILEASNLATRVDVIKSILELNTFRVVESTLKH